MKREVLALFGGSFDPITNAHISVIRELSARFCEVVVMPSHVSPFKREMETASDEVRFNLINECCKDYKNVTVSDYELKNGKVSYSYNTVQHFKEQGKTVYFTIGSDMLADLNKWKNVEYLKQNTVFYVVKRPYFEIDESVLQQRTNEGFKIEIAPFIGEEGSSSLLKVAVAFDKAREIVPKNVAKYVKDNNLYCQYKTIVDKYPLFKMKDSRIRHTYSVAKESIILAKTHHLDVEKAIRASLLHDIGKYVSEEELKAMGITCSQKINECEDAVKHCYRSLAIARQHLKESDEDVLNAIENHTTGRENMSDLEKVVFLADYTEEGRDFDGVDLARKICAKSLDEGMVFALEKTVEYLKKNDKNIDKRTIYALEFYKKNLKEKENVREQERTI